MKRHSRHIEFVNGSRPYISFYDDNFSEWTKNWYLLQVANKKDFYIALCYKNEYFEKSNLMIDYGKVYKPIYVNELPEEYQNRLIKLLEKYNYENDTINTILNEKLVNVSY